MKTEITPEIEHDFKQWQQGTTIQYGGCIVKASKDFGTKGTALDHAWVVVRKGCNVMPGATWARSMDEACRLIDVLIVAETITGPESNRGPHRVADVFWHLLRATQRGEYLPHNITPHAAPVIEKAAEVLQPWSKGMRYPKGSIVGYMSFRWEAIYDISISNLEPSLSINWKNLDQPHRTRAFTPRDDRDLDTVAAGRRDTMGREPPVWSEAMQQRATEIGVDLDSAYASLMDDGPLPTVAETDVKIVEDYLTRPSLQRFVTVEDTAVALAAFRRVAGRAKGATVPAHHEHPKVG